MRELMETLQKINESEAPAPARIAEPHETIGEILNYDIDSTVDVSNIPNAEEQWEKERQMNGDIDWYCNLYHEDDGRLLLWVGDPWDV